MKKIILPALMVGLMVCATEAEATSAGLAMARANLYNAKMRSYNAQINYYQKASLHYLKKMPALTAKKYKYKVPAAYKASRSYAKKSVSVPRTTSTKLVAPTASTMNRAINAQSTSELMAALKNFGQY